MPTFNAAHVAVVGDASEYKQAATDATPDSRTPQPEIRVLNIGPVGKQRLKHVRKLRAQFKEAVPPTLWEPTPPSSKRVRAPAPRSRPQLTHVGKFRRPIVKATGKFEEALSKAIFLL
mmetsp:Transcript_124862/g.249335  ORF Transcript_124862/g.249335 Transcript_124862/m.249335 type:complete len:118 (-) Transcript_124862:145-498(-)|eukprot:CAMPEP_0172677820 /NCGR_PEP_ID=MMETSP1074-20121228/14949_1 /TAXON_ID=2916 /ORGANISM="Ceratium fusus, Strain PA161109" /LENGTH=117 /DNA_ID=CAMNT_0013495727 /DNA_START=66 /DNA_END=419 /DNA_ORIENTATION=-